MKCKATVRSIMKAGPCYSSTQIKSLFRKLKVDVITPKMVSNLKLGNRTRMERDNSQCHCAGCVRDTIICTRDRLWGLLNCFGLKSQTIKLFVFPEILRLMKKLWPDAPDLVIQYLKTGKSRAWEVDIYSGVINEFLKIQLNEGASADQMFMACQVQRFLTDKPSGVRRSAYILLKMCAKEVGTHSLTWYVKKLAEVCEAQI